MPVVKFSLSDEHYLELEQMSKKEGLSMQDFIRNKLFQLTTIYTSDEAVKMAEGKYKSGETFTLPELYGDKWDIKQGHAGVFGKRFFKDIEDGLYPNIRYVEKIGKHAQYEMI